MSAGHDAKVGLVWLRMKSIYGVISMAQVINTSTSSLAAQRNLDESEGLLANYLQRLSPGLRINSAKDDVAGLAVSGRFPSRIRGLNLATRSRCCSYWVK